MNAPRNLKFWNKNLSILVDIVLTADLKPVLNYAYNGLGLKSSSINSSVSKNFLKRASAPPSHARFFILSKHQIDRHKWNQGLEYIHGNFVLFRRESKEQSSIFTENIEERFHEILSEERRELIV